MAAERVRWKDAAGQPWRRWLTAFAVVGSALVAAAANYLRYAPAPMDNPLKGLVPYMFASGKERFPHSMEFRYFQWRELMTGPGGFDWDPRERVLDDVKGRWRLSVPARSS